MQEVLVSHPSGAGVVRGDDGWVMVTGDVDDGGAAVGIRREDRYHPEKSWVAEERSVVGGWLPPGAVSAEVVDDRGARVAAEVANGAYVAVIDQPNDGYEAIVCCRDATGRPVRRPWAAEYSSVRVTDATESCPACGALDWEEYQPFEQWRGGSGSKVDGTMVANPVVCCRVCGHEEAEGSFMAMSRSVDESEDETARAARLATVRAQLRRRQWTSGAQALRATPFVIYAAEGWTGRLAGHATQDGVVTEITVHHYLETDPDPFTSDPPRLVVMTQHDPRFPTPVSEAARDALEQQIRNDPDDRGWPEASHAAITLHLRARARETRGQVLAATRSERQLTIDDVSTRAVVLSTPSRGWAAAARQGDLLVTVAAREIDLAELRLKPISDPIATLLGPEPPDA